MRVVVGYTGVVFQILLGTCLFEAALIVTLR